MNLRIFGDPVAIPSRSGSDYRDDDHIDCRHAGVGRHRGHAGQTGPLTSWTLAVGRGVHDGRSLR